MNNPTFPDHTSLKTKLAVAAIAAGWVSFITCLFIPLAAYLWIKSAFTSPRNPQ